MGDPEPVGTVLNSALDEATTAGLLGGNAIQALAPYIDDLRDR
jgi:hypothetical protein